MDAAGHASRRRKSAKERREQKQRSDARHVGWVLKAIRSLEHRGSQPTKLLTELAGNLHTTHGDLPPATVLATLVPLPATPPPVCWYGRACRHGRNCIFGHNWSEPKGLPLQQTPPLAAQSEMDEHEMPAACARHSDLDPPGQVDTILSVKPAPVSVTVDSTSADPTSHTSIAASSSYDLRLRLSYLDEDFGIIAVRDDSMVDQLLEQAATRILGSVEDIVGIVNGFGYQYGLELGNIGELRTSVGLARGAEVLMTLDLADD